MNEHLQTHAFLKLAIDIDLENLLIAPHTFFLPGMYYPVN